MQKHITNVIVRNMLSAVDAAIKQREVYFAELAKARVAFKGKSRDDVRAAIIDVIGTYRNVTILPGEGKAKGIRVFDRNAMQYESAKRDLRMILNDICGEASNDAKPSEPTKVRLSAAEKDAARALLAACGGDLKRAVAALKAVAV